MNKLRNEIAIKGTDFILVPSYQNVAKFESVSGMGLYEFAEKLIYRQFTITEIVKFVWAFSGADKEADVGEVLMDFGVGKTLDDISEFLKPFLATEEDTPQKKPKSR